MNRRDFLRAAATGAAFLSVPAAVAAVAASSGSADDRAWTEDHPDLLSVLGPETVRRIGARYRETVPAEDDRRVLHALLASRSTAAAVHEDFAYDRTVVIDGWLLSTTDARQCALFSLGA